MPSIANRFSFLTFFGLAVVLCLSDVVIGDDWRCWHRPRNGLSAETLWSDQWPKSGPAVVWRAEVGVGFSSITVADGRLYTLGNVDNVESVFCLDAFSGKTIWKHDYECPLDDRFFEGGPTSTPTIDGDHVFTLSRQGHLFCFQAKTGEVVWSKNIAEETGASVPGWGFSASPVVHEKSLLLGVGEAGTLLDKATGEVTWTSGNGEAGYMTPRPVILDDHWYALIASGRAYQLVDLTSGELLWKHRWLTTYGCNAADPLVDGRRVLISSGYNRGARLLDMTAQSVKSVWANKEMQNQLNSSVMLGDYVYGFSGNDTGEVELMCIEFATGEKKWTAHGLGLGSLVAAGARLIILSGDGELVVAPASPEQFQPTAQARILSGKCWTVPVLAGGHIYCRNAAGELACVNVRREN